MKLLTKKFNYKFFLIKKLLTLFLKKKFNKLKLTLKLNIVKKI